MAKTENAEQGAARKTKEVTQMGPKMYVGPTVAGIGIQNRVYTEIPVDAREKATDMPEVMQLFIPVEQYPIANKMLREKKGYIYSAFRKVAGIRIGGNEV